jgi:hypothetical protein
MLEESWMLGTPHRTAWMRAFKAYFSCLATVSMLQQELQLGSREAQSLKYFGWSGLQGQSPSKIGDGEIVRRRGRHMLGLSLSVS